MKGLDYKNYMLGMLMVVQAFATMDNIVIGIVLQSIKLDLHLSDLQLGFLTGMAYALFYAVMGLPIARWADRGNRVFIIGLAASAWSIMVSLCGLAASFAQLLLVRIGVAVGEAGCAPAANSLIADHFGRAERPRASSIYMLGANLGLLIGYPAVGWLNQIYGWRVTFIAMGLPGLIPAILVWLTLKEPRRTAKVVSAPVIQPPLLEVGRTLWRSHTFRNLLFCWSVAAFFGSGMGQWAPTFFIRSFGMKTGELGQWFALIYGVGGGLGIFLGGYLASRFAAKNERLQMKGMGLVYCFCGVTAALSYLSPNVYLTFTLLAICHIAGYTIAGPLFATVQSLVPPRMRAVAFAILYLFANLIGLGLGPMATGALSDALHPWLGQESLRYALLVFTAGYLWCGWHAWRGSRTVTADLALVEGRQEGGPQADHRVGALAQ
jgi:MFS family permease